MSSIDCRVARLFVHPVKSCAGVEVDAAPLVATGLAHDRGWLVVDDAGRMLTQRQWPRMALIRPTADGDALRLDAPGMPALRVAAAGGAPVAAQVWGETVAGLDAGAEAVAWFSAFLGHPARLLRFAPGQRRLSSREWTGAIEAENAFSDGFPILVASAASLGELNRRLAARGHAPVGIERFRPNLVLDGLEPFDEDHLDEIRVEADGGAVTLKLLKPCVRCAIPNVDPATAATGAEPGATLATFRADPRMDGGITFGINAVVVDGFGRRLVRGAGASAVWAF